ncbi:family 20 glycosylhydrolase [Bacteroides zoogleoformans]|uniref:family 20 glycosylhydrolase n=1 Tax=Bacteroides zoogleoformans TaxID=28119 RepID=UPI003CD0C959
MLTLRNIPLLMAATALFLSFSTSRAENNAKPFTIPELKEWKGGEGYFDLSGQTSLVFDKNNSNVAEVAKLFAEDCRLMFGFSPQTTPDAATKGNIRFRLSSKPDLGEEGYRIRIGEDIEVSASDAKGLYWATRTLLQMAEQNERHRLPEGVITDFPDYPVRGFMIDCGRKFIPMAYLKDLLKVMAYYKMNTLQVHLNDNGFKEYFENDWNKTYAAFRLECETFPGLTARDGHYTKQEFIALQEEAKRMGINVIPEIDVPAHALAFTQYKPSIGSKEYGMDHLDLFNPETYTFVDALFKEYLEGEKPVFRGPQVHIGTDEYSNKDKAVVEKFRAFTDHYIRYVESFGKQAVVWGALTHAKGKTAVKAENVIMGAWYNGYANPLEMLDLGYKLISIPDGLTYIVPAAGYYYDYLNTKRLYESWTPAQIGSIKIEERHPSLLGGMFAVWNDHVGNGISVKDIHHRVYPALQTLAVKMWTGRNVSCPYDVFDEKRTALSEAPGVNQLGRIGRQKGLVYELPQLTPGTATPHCEIGYGYKVSFDVEGREEAKGTVLFRSPTAEFYLSDPISGMMGFARDGYLHTFNYRVMPGEKVSISIEGDNKSTRLYVNGKLREELNILRRDFVQDDSQKTKKMYYVRTLVFPLKEAGTFNSIVRNLKVYNVI